MFCIRHKEDMMVAKMISLQPRGKKHRVGPAEDMAQLRGRRRPLLAPEGADGLPGLHFQNAVPGRAVLSPDELLPDRKPLRGK